MKIKLFGYTIKIRIHKKRRRGHFVPGAWNQLMTPGLRKEFENSYKFFGEEYLNIPESEQERDR